MVFHKMIPVFSGKIKVVKRYENTCNYISKLVFLWCNETRNTGIKHGYGWLDRRLLACETL